MVDHIGQLEKWLESGKKLAIARVVSTWRSSPRPAGSSLVVTEDGDMMGSVSGGCVEKAVVARALKVMESGESALVSYGVADEDAWEVGLSCGGALSVFIQPFFDIAMWKELREAAEKKEGRILITNLDEGGKNTLVTPGTAWTHSGESIREESLRLYGLRKNGTIEVGEQQYFQHSLPPKPKMILIGSAHISSELTSLAHLYGFETALIDPRDTFAKKTHFESNPGVVHVNWPQEILPDYTLNRDTYVVILSHDPKIDDEALKLVLRSEVRYIGALGSKKTHAKRVARLQVYGFTEEEITRIKAPIGISINSHSAAEIALSIMAQVIQSKNS
ncbi:MAG: XdhC family protein [Roseivirga sp.]|nr:XdhC family protein [Roseivirga sp.]